MTLVNTTPLLSSADPLRRVYTGIADQLNALHSQMQAAAEPSVEQLAEWSGRLSSIVSTSQLVASPEHWPAITKAVTTIFSRLVELSPRPDALRERFTVTVSDLMAKTAVTDTLVLGPRNSRPVWRSATDPRDGASASLTLNRDGSALVLSAQTEPGYRVGDDEKPSFMLLVGEKVHHLGAGANGEVNLRRDREDTNDMQPVTVWQVEARVKAGDVVTLIHDDRVACRLTAV